MSYWCGDSKCEEQNLEGSHQALTAATLYLPMEQPGGIARLLHILQPIRERKIAIFGKAY